MVVVRGRLVKEAATMSSIAAPPAEAPLEAQRIEQGMVNGLALDDIEGFELADLGLGVSTNGREMKVRLCTWGYEVAREACQDMLWSSRFPAQAVIEITLKKTETVPKYRAFT